MSKKRINQSEIAHQLGVSQALVSMVLNGRKEGISPSTFERIWEVAVANGYTPKGMRMDTFNQNQKVARTVGYFLRYPLRLATKSNFFSHVTQGLHDSLLDHGLSLVFLGGEVDFDDKMKARAKGLLPSLCGIVVLGEVNEPFRGWIETLALPTVIVSARAPGVFHSVNSNEEKATGLLIDHLVELGHGDFGYLGGLSPRGRNKDRLDAFERNLQRHGLKLNKKWVHVDDDAERSSGYAMMEKLVTSSKQKAPTAVVCVNALMARGACAYLRQMGLKPGKDVSIAAVDMTRVCTEEHPYLTSAASMPEDLGREAGRILVGAKDSTTGAFQDVILPAKLEIRESTGPLKVKSK